MSFPLSVVRLAACAPLAVWAMLAGCGGEGGGGGSCIDANCVTPPAPACVDGELTTALPFGSCDGEACVYSQSTVTCDFGCDDSGAACADESTCNVDDCDEAPTDECDGDELIVYGEASCDPESGACSWAQERVDCTADGRACVDGACVDVCDVDCSVDPAASCDGDVSVVLSGGVCEAGECAYTEVRTDCAAEDEVCLNGACVAADCCETETCEDLPRPGCDGDVVVTVVAAGACNDSTCECEFDEVRTACGAGEVCLRGACVEQDPCTGVVCETPPAPTCDGTVSIVAGAFGSCVDGDCVYPTVDEDCADDDLFCNEGICVEEDPCARVVCVLPPAAECRDAVAVTWGAGECSSGECVYEESLTDCGSLGKACFDGGCYDIDPCAGVTCDAGPADFCDGPIAVDNDPAGTCTAGECSYAQRRRNCASFGASCVEGACVLPDRCDGVVCEAPPASVCDGDVMLAYEDVGSCDASDGSCDYVPANVDCAALPDGYCFGGECRTSDPCFGRDCDTPPVSRCDGRTAVSFGLPGSCNNGLCLYEQTRENCGAIELGYCFDGACTSLDPCFGVACDVAAEPVCDGDTAVSFALPGVCDNGECQFAESRDNCASRDQYCFDGQCVGNDPCLAVTCDTPPLDGCEQNVAVDYAAAGACIPGGTCDYASTRTDCAASSQFCSAGRCVAVDPCLGVSCDEPPTSACDGDTAIQYGAGLCSDGVCEFEPFVVDCRLVDGGYCFDGACSSTDPCFEVSCDVARAAECDGSVARTFSLPGACVAGECAFVEDREDCAAYNGGYCFEGACGSTDPCFRVTCEVPPAPICDGDAVLAFGLPGACVAGGCEWDVERTPCAAGEFCASGRCLEIDPCVDLVCNSPPPNRCDARTAVVYNGESTCANGVCDYLPTEVDCAARGLFCEEGICVPFDPCDGVVCDSLPAARCSGDTRVSYAFPGACLEGNCRFTEYRERCDFVTYGRCIDGACEVSDPCEGVACTTPPAPSCDGSLAITYVAPGVCADGGCEWGESVVNCATSGRFCEAGACVERDPCAGISCNTPPGAVCLGTRRLAFASPGACSDGLCAYAPIDEDCADRGMVCEDGVCVTDDGCSGIICLEPPDDFCEGNVARQWTTPGLCTTGACSYELARVDCAANGEYCYFGDCVVQDPCTNISCAETVAPYCDGRVVVDTVSPGACVAGLCDYDGARTDCAPLGQFCFAGECVNDDPCVDLVCDFPPASATCQGNTAVSYRTPGTCADGECSYEEVRQLCSTSGQVCFGGACVTENPCLGVVCMTPPAPGCEGETAVVYGSTGECTAGECTYAAASRVDCAATGQFCQRGACIDEDPCLGVECTEGLSNVCVGDLLLSFATVGVCVSGNCEYDTTERDCAASGLLCIDGACRDSDPCLGVVCSDVPADYCDSTVAVSFAADGNNCYGGECFYRSGRLDCEGVQSDFCDGTTAVRYVDGGCIEDGVCGLDSVVEDDCAALGFTCVSGRCLDPNGCDGVVCDAPPAGVCVGDVSRTYTSPGACTGGACNYAPVDRDCAALGQFCFAGGCIAVDPCIGVSCDEPPADVCLGGEAFRWVSPGECRNGTCFYDSVRQTCGVGTVCSAGSCVVATCDNVQCNAAPGPTCADANSRALSAAEGTCAGGICSYAQTIVDCAAGSVCIEGGCYNGDVLPGELVITEIHARASGGIDTQWIELRNQSADTFDIGGIEVLFGSDVVVRLGATAVPAGGYVILAGPAAVLPVTPASLWPFGAGLDAVADSITVRFGDVVLDQVAWSAGVPWPFAAGRSAQLDVANFGSDNSLPVFWCTSAAAYSATDRGTPGFTNASCF